MLNSYQLIYLYEKGRFKKIERKRTWRISSTASKSISQQLKEMCITRKAVRRIQIESNQSYAKLFVDC